ncbi:hypothetical protein HLH34_15355 [Gluconacetobacter azotocaptans]|uniref:Uncharacterized protein n=1 Tax=Gluconacetobacter azotocaptans TaxID=142834 RepID=A0A7W4JUX6_9PROT|nr:hypothetical protein [Gluconacetobacter azotocaptans]MBB2191318.1 hypothetical protein [Gluconacetobacter azotocaptans]GBQ34282.1 hypothetical protein AA13594_2850 [Gluconacetobacter azotocaptans DSM 13594]
MVVQQVAFAAQSYQARAVALDAQRCVNFYAEFAPKDAKSPVAVWGCPGMVAFARCGDGPVQGMCLMGGALYVVSGQVLYRVDADGSSVELGATLVTGPVSMDTNGVDLVWVDGESGWSYSVAGGVRQIVDENFHPADSVVYFDTYFVFNRSGTQQFFLSPQSGVVPFDGTMFASKEATADPLLAIVNTHEQLLLFGAARTEVWYDAGNAPPAFPFQRFEGAFIQRGIAGAHAHCLEDNTVFFLGDDGMFYRLSGFQPQRISTHATEGAWQAYATRADARCFSYTFGGHKFVTLLFPSARATWVYDVATGLWHERESWTGGSAETSIGRWRGNAAVMAYDRILIGDSLSGTVGQLNGAVYTELGATMRGLLAAPPVHDARRRVFMRRFELDVETGVGLPAAAATAQAAYQPVGALMVAPTALTRAAAPVGTPASIANLLVNLWVCLPDDGMPRGVLIGNARPGEGGPGFSIALANDRTAPAAQIVVAAADVAGNPVVAASYAHDGWGDWVNVQLSLSPATRMLQLFVDGAPLAPASVAWASDAPVGNPAGQGWMVTPWNGTDDPVGVLADPQFGGHTAGTGTGWNNAALQLDQSGNMISLAGGTINAVSRTGAVVWTLAPGTVQADILGVAPGVNMASYGVNACTVLLRGRYLAVGVQAGAYWCGVALYAVDGGGAPGFRGFVYNDVDGPGPIYGANTCFLAGNQTIDDPILSYQVAYPAVPKVVLVYPSIAQIIGGAAKTGGLNGLYPGLGNLAAWGPCQVPVIEYYYPASLGNHLPGQVGYNGNAGFFLPDGQGGTNHYLYFSRGDMAANAGAGGNTNTELRDVIGPACPGGAMVKIAMGAVSYDMLAGAHFAGNGTTSFTGTLPMYSIDNAHWVDGDGAAQIPFADEYSYITTGRPGGTDVYGGQPSLTPLPGSDIWLVTFLKVGRSDSRDNRGNAGLWDTVRVFAYSGGTATQVGAPVSGAAYDAAADWAGYEPPPAGYQWADRNAVAYPWGGEILIFGNMSGSAVGTYPLLVGAQYCTRFGTLNVAAAQVADLFVGLPAAPFDLSVGANRALFRTAQGGACYPGADGARPLGAPPPVLLSVPPGGDASAFAVNRGAGGAFVPGGTLLPAASNPPGSTYTETLDPGGDAPPGADPQIMLDWSDDGARTWSARRLWRSLGRQGAYLTRLRWLKMGQARQRVLRLQVTDPVRRNLIGFYLDTESGME